MRGPVKESIASSLRKVGKSPEGAVLISLARLCSFHGLCLLPCDFAYSFLLEKLSTVIQRLGKM